jgi:tetratricopeptide (TPR) repeat protein
MRLIVCLLFSAALLLRAESLAEIFEQAVKALSSGDYSTAEAGFEKVLAASPDHIGALQNLGLVYSRTERLDQAVAIYRRGLSLNPNHKGLLMNLGVVYVRQESYAAALPLFQSLVKLDPQSLPARELLATCEFYTGQLSAATARFESLRKEDPKNTDIFYLLSLAYLRQNQPDKLALLTHALQPAVPGPPGQTSFIMCRAYVDAGRVEEAVYHCRKTVQIDPNFPGLHREMGKLLSLQRDPEATRELSAAVRQNPGDAEALYSLGIALLQDDRVEEAAQSLDRALRLRPAFWGNYYYLGKARLEAGQADLAASLLQKAAELNPRASAVFYELGRALKAAGKIPESELAMQKVRDLRAIELESDIKALQKR